MLRILFRLFNWVLLLAIVFIATRFMIRTLPGDPVETLIAESGTSISAEVIRHDLGLDRPFWLALSEDFKQLSKGNLGTSLLTKKPIAPLLVNRLCKTIQLASLTLILSLTFSLILGIAAAASRGGWTDLICSWYGSLAAALPMTWIGPILLLIFAVKIPIFPVGGHPALPAGALALSLSGFWSRLVRERVRESLFRGSAQGARARGIHELKVLLKYGLTPASGMLAAYFGTQFGGLLAGTFVVETIFDWRGLGSMLIDSVLKRDYPVVEASAFVAAAMSLFGIFVGDWLQDRVDNP